MILMTMMTMSMKLIALTTMTLMTMTFIVSSVKVKDVMRLGEQTRKTVEFPVLYSQVDAVSPTAVQHIR